MNYSSFPYGSFQQDTLLIHQETDTAVRLSTESKIQTVPTETQTAQPLPAAIKDSAAFVIMPETRVDKNITEASQAAKAVYNPFRKTFNTGDNFLTNNSLTQIGQHLSGVYSKNSMTGRWTAATVSPAGNMKLNDQIHPIGNWLMFIFIAVVLLFIWIKIFYNKFFTILSNSLVSYQLSAKVFNERNVLLKRVSFVLDIIYLIVLSLFLYEFFNFLDLAPLKMTSYNLFLLLFNIVILITLIRGSILKLFNYLFQTESVVSEYVHNNFIINKSIGIVLFPVVFAVCYMPEGFVRFLLWAGLIILGAGIIFKIVRGYQIIIRKDVLFIYLILYLCTLEILPLLLGYKVFMLLL